MKNFKYIFFAISSLMFTNIVFADDDSSGTLWITVDTVSSGKPVYFRYNGTVAGYTYFNNQPMGLKGGGSTLDTQTVSFYSDPNMQNLLCSIQEVFNDNHFSDFSVPNHEEITLMPPNIYGSVGNYYYEPISQYTHTRDDADKVILTGPAAHNLSSGYDCEVGAIAFQYDYGEEEFDPINFFVDSYLVVRYNN